MPATAIIVPCRLESTRFPRKLLHPIRGKPLLLWVAERIRTQTPEIPVVFAVDDPLLAGVVEPHGFKTVLTSVAHQSGTDRLAEANRSLKADVVINVQADEPQVTREQILALAARVNAQTPMATLATPFLRPEDFANPNQVKVVCDTTMHALYFSRAPIPFPRDLSGKPDENWLKKNPPLRHLGLYAYRSDFLQTFSALPPGRLEQIEKLEQLRVLENGHRIAVALTQTPSIGIDTAEDAGHFERTLG